VRAHMSLLAGLAEEAIDNRSALFASVRSLIEALARERATLFIFEDVHWADRSLLDLIEWMAAHIREVPAMFVTLARPELLDARPSWGGGIPRYAGISLDPLPAKDTRELALQLLRDHADSEAAAQQVEAAAGGNPLFVEELAAAMAEGATGPANELPLAIRATIAARLDGLPAAERRLLLYASVVGNVFWGRVLERLAGSETAVVALLDHLEFRDLVRREWSSRMEGEEQYSFKHVLIREVAYSTLPRAARRAHHATVAELLEETPSFAADSAATLAHHWREADRPERAIPYLLVAAEQAGREWAKAEAVAIYNQALELLPQGDGRRREVELRRAIAYAALTHFNLSDVPVPQTPPSRP
jgi:predicted ATPase